jgi:hypothetical protein
MNVVHVEVDHDYREVATRRGYDVEPFDAVLIGGAPWVFWHRVRALSGKHTAEVLDLPPMFKISPITTRDGRKIMSVDPKTRTLLDKLVTDGFFTAWKEEEDGDVTLVAVTSDSAHFEYEVTTYVDLHNLDDRGVVERRGRPAAQLEWLLNYVRLDLAPDIKIVGVLDPSARSTPGAYITATSRNYTTVADFKEHYAPDAAILRVVIGD